MSGNVTGNDTGNVSRTSNHIISNDIKLVNRNLVQNGIQWFFDFDQRMPTLIKTDGSHLHLRVQPQ